VSCAFADNPAVAAKEAAAFHTVRLDWITTSMTPHAPAELAVTVSVSVPAVLSTTIVPTFTWLEVFVKKLRRDVQVVPVGNVTVPVVEPVTCPTM
jgi:hypothetical protein